MSAKNITFNNVTYDDAFFSSWNYTSDNINASIKAMERVEKIQTYSLFLNSSIEIEDQPYQKYFYKGYPYDTMAVMFAR